MGGVRGVDGVVVIVVGAVGVVVDKAQRPPRHTHRASVLGRHSALQSTSSRGAVRLRHWLQYVQLLRSVQSASARQARSAAGGSARARVASRTAIRSRDRGTGASLPGAGCDTQGRAAVGGLAACGDDGPVTDALCPLHGRTARSTCERCGVFRCDWCEKLEPTWGAGLCAGCLRLSARQYRPPMRLPFWRMTLVVLLGFVAATRILAVAQAVAARQLEPVGLVKDVAVGVLAALAVAAILRASRRR